MEKRMSILGDSISTYRGVSDDAAAEPTIVGNPWFYRDPFPREKTYWHLVAEALGYTLCVNNSWSGGNLSGAEEHAGVSRARHLARGMGERPTLVILFMGINDLGRGVDVSVFAADYQRAVDTILREYPEAAVCCVNLPDRDPYFKPRTEQFNAAIAGVAATDARCLVADLFHSRLNNDGYYFNTLDGLHPDEDGMRMIAEVIVDALRQRGL